MTILYHGTSEETARKALTEGLKPRRLTGTSNWRLKSQLDAVYLTNAYAPYYACSAIKRKGQKLGIVGVDIDRLSETLLRPDEDVVEQTTRSLTSADIPESADSEIQKTFAGLVAVGKDMGARTRYIRRHLSRLSGLWDFSLARMGTCSYQGTIPPDAITRISIYDTRSNPRMSIAIIDPSISVLNYQFMGDHYRLLTQWFFRPVTPKEYCSTKMAAMTRKFTTKAMRESDAQMLANRSGLEVIDNPNSHSPIKEEKET